MRVSEVVRRPWHSAERHIELSIEAQITMLDGDLQGTIGAPYRWIDGVRE
jgi:hypothetical protein